MSQWWSTMEQHLAGLISIWREEDGRRARSQPVFSNINPFTLTSSSESLASAKRQVQAYSTWLQLDLSILLTLTFCWFAFLSESLGAAYDSNQFEQIGDISDFDLFQKNTFLLDFLKVKRFTETQWKFLFEDTYNTRKTNISRTMPKQKIMRRKSQSQKNIQIQNFKVYNQEFQFLFKLYNN